MRPRGPALLLLVCLLVAGCVTPPAALTPGATVAPGSTTSVHERASLPFVHTGNYSRTLVNGTLAILEPQSVFVDVKLPATEGLAGADGSAKAHLGLWLPDVPAGTKVPVIADVGPYYGDGDDIAIEPAHRLGAFLIENFVPHGYAVAQVSVFGTGDSTHCMDLMGRAEQAGIDAAVTWLGSQEWSNGNVGLIGRSYDGSTPWEAAMFGNEHLKTIVPISGLIGVHELMWRNGSAEARAPILGAIYTAFSIDAVKPLDGELAPDPAELPGDAHSVCPAALQHVPQGLAGVVTGDRVAPMANPYFTERSFLDAALTSYKGSVFLIHGLQDWNVDNHMAFPTYHKLQDAGFEVKGLFGQWAHMYPDRAEEHKDLPEGRGAEAYPASVRMDWAQDLLEWFDHYLKGTGARPALQAEVQDNTGLWRVEESYPPRDALWTEHPLADMKLTGGSAVVTPLEGVAFDIAPLSETEDVRIAGNAQLHVQVVPVGPGGQLFAMLTDAQTGLHLGHAIMDLRYAAGGNEMRPVVPGQATLAKMEFEAFDVVVPAGHGLRLSFTTTGDDYLPSVVSTPVEVLAVAESVLRLPTVVREMSVFFVPPGFEGEATGDTPGM